jgi:hypothetical protein
MNKFKRVSIFLTALGLLAASHGLLAEPPGGEVGQPAGKPARSTVKDRADDPGIKALIEARLATARAVYESEIHRYEAMLTVPPDDTAVWSRRWMEEQNRLNPGPSEVLSSIRGHLERVKRLEAIADGYAKTGQGRTSDALKMKYFRLEAEQLFAEARAAHPELPVPAPKGEGGERGSIPRRPPAPPR